MREEKVFAIEATKMRIRHKIAGALDIYVPTTTEGPNFSLIESKSVQNQIKEIIGGDCADFLIPKDFAVTNLGEHKVNLVFDTGEPFTLTINMKIEFEEIPEDFRDTWDHADALVLSTQDHIDQLIQDALKQGAQQPETETHLRMARLLKTAHIMGYWKTIDTQRLFQRWRAEEQALKIVANKPSSVDGASQTHVEGLSKEVVEKLKVLDLPPLVAHDLINAVVDTDTLQKLFVFPQFRHLKGKDSKDFSDDDIRLLSPVTNWSISDLKSGRNERGSKRFSPVDSRALAKILLSIARLQFDRLPIGTSEADIRYCLSGYCTRLGEYLVQQHGRYDFARDFFLEAITINITNPKWEVAFPTALLFRSFPNDDRVRSFSKAAPSDFLQLIDESRWQKNEIFQTAIRSFLELGARHLQLAIRWFDEYSLHTKKRLLTLAQNQLRLSGLADFPDCVHSFQQKMGQFQTLLRQMKGSTSVHGIAQLRKQFDEQFNELGFLLSPTNREICGVLAQAAESTERFIQSKTYEEQRNSADTTINSLEKVLNYGADNYTALWAEHLGAIAEQWRKLIGNEIDAIAQNIVPFLEVVLVEANMCLTNERDGNPTPTAIFEIRNTGSGQATGINVQFNSSDGTIYLARKQKPFLKPKESFQDYIEFRNEDRDKTIELNYKVSFYDPDRQIIEFEV